MSVELIPNFDCNNIELLILPHACNHACIHCLRFCANVIFLLNTFYIYNIAIVTERLLVVAIYLAA